MSMGLPEEDLQRRVSSQRVPPLVQQQPSSNCSSSRGLSFCITRLLLVLQQQQREIAAIDSLCLRDTWWFRRR